VEFDGSPPSPADTALVATCAQASGIYRRAARSVPQRGAAPMTIRVGINGFGRVGRQVYRAMRTIRIGSTSSPSTTWATGGS
jgi:hypothetical protein